MSTSNFNGRVYTADPEILEGIYLSLCHDGIGRRQRKPQRSCAGSGSAEEQQQRRPILLGGQMPLVWAQPCPRQQTIFSDRRALMQQHVSPSIQHQTSLSKSRLTMFPAVAAVTLVEEPEHSCQWPRLRLAVQVHKHVLSVKHIDR